MKRFILLCLVLLFNGCLGPSMGTTIEGVSCARDADGKIPLSCAVETLKVRGYQEMASSGEGNIYQWPFPLQAGDRLTEGIVSDASNAEETTLAVPSDSWFFFLDQAPGALWNHPTEFVLVDQRTGALSSYTRDSYPKVNGVTLFQTAEEQSASDVRIPGFSYRDSDTDFSALTFPEPTPIDGGQQTEEQAQQELDKCPLVACEGTAKKFALVIDGGRVFGDFGPLVEYLRNNGYQTRYLSSEIGDPADPETAQDFPTSLPNIQAAFDWLAENVSNCCDEVFIAMEAHGSKNGGLEMNPEQTVRDFSSSDAAATKKIGRPDGGMLFSSELKSLLNKIKSCQVKVFIESCYSGSHLELGLNRIPEDAQGCLCRTVVVSSNADQVSYAGGFDSFAQGFQENGRFDEAYRRLNQWSRDWSGDFTDLVLNPLVQSTDCILCLDLDEDGILTGEELDGSLSDPELEDTDGDGLPDPDEVRLGTQPREEDSDGDGMRDGEEVERRTDPLNPDSDGDGLSDRYETYLQCDPNNPDTDGDGLTDGQEVYQIRTQPTNRDTDGDGCTDGEEVANGTDPLNPNSHG